MAITAAIKGKKLFIEIDLKDPPELSASRKNLVIASSGGNRESNCKFNDKTVTIGLNAYVKSD